MTWTGLVDRIGTDRVAYVDDAVLLIRARFQDVVHLLPTVDHTILDAPYSKRTHAGHDAGAALETKANAERWARPSDGVLVPLRKRRKLTYPHWDPADVARCVKLLAPLTSGWFVSLTDHVLARVWENRLDDAGRYVFAPLPFVDSGARVRLTGDGPSQWTTQIVVARTPALLRWGTIKGAYIMPPGQRDRQQHGGNGYAVVGGKPLWLMRELVADYSRQDDLLLDACAGGGTLGVAAKQLRRRAILIEQDGDTCELAAERLLNTRVQIPLALQCGLTGGEQAELQINGAVSATAAPSNTEQRA